jgi:hypothetical protein
MLREEIKNIGGSRKELRKFGFVMTFICIVWGGVLFALGEGYILLYVLAAVFFTAALRWPRSLLPFYRAGAAALIIVVNIISLALLTIIFFLIMVPVGLAGRCSGKRFLELKFPGEKESYWTIRTVPDKSKRSYKSQY